MTLKTSFHSNDNNYRMRGFHIIIITMPNSIILLYHRKQMQTLKVNNLLDMYIPRGLLIIEIISIINN